MLHTAPCSIEYFMVDFGTQISIWTCKKLLLTPQNIFYLITLQGGGLKLPLMNTRTDEDVMEFPLVDFEKEPVIHCAPWFTVPRDSLCPHSPYLVTIYWHIEKNKHQYLLWPRLHMLICVHQNLSTKHYISIEYIHGNKLMLLIQ